MRSFWEVGNSFEKEVMEREDEVTITGWGINIREK